MGGPPDHRYQHDIVAVVRRIDGSQMKEFARLLEDATGEPAR